MFLVIFLLDLVRVGFNGAGVLDNDLHAAEDMVDFLRIVCFNHNFALAVVLVFILEDGIDNAVGLGHFAELLEIGIRNFKDFQLLTGLDHVGQTHLSLRLIRFLCKILEHLIKEDCNLFRSLACDFQGSLSSFECHSQDLICRFA